MSLDPDDYEGYGEEMKTLVNSINTLSNENAQLKHMVQGVSQTVASTAKDRYYGKLDEAVPDWEETNKNPKFLQWLNEAHPFSGKTRHELLQEADRKLDVGRVGAIFKSFKNGGVGMTESKQPEGRREQAGITAKTVNEAIRDFQTGRITEEECNNILNRFQSQAARR